MHKTCINIALRLYLIIWNENLTGYLLNVFSPHYNSQQDIENFKTEYERKQLTDTDSPLTLARVELEEEANGHDSVVETSSNSSS